MSEENITQIPKYKLNPKSRKGTKKMELAITKDEQRRLRSIISEILLMKKECKGDADFRSTIHLYKKDLEVLRLVFNQMIAISEKEEDYED